MLLSQRPETNIKDLVTLSQKFLLQGNIPDAQASPDLICIVLWEFNLKEPL